MAQGPRGGAAAGVVGPEGGAAGAVRGPRGGAAAGVVGPGGGAAGAVWGPRGYGVAGVRGPYGGRYLTTLPGGAVHYPWHDHDYWHVDFDWFEPIWDDDDVYYGWVYPPVGYYYPSLPPDHETIVIENNTYYESNGVYYEEGEKEGQEGYVVAEIPESLKEEAAAEAEGKNPFDILEGACRYLAGLTQFSAVARTTNDKVGEQGEKVQISGRRAIAVSRPDKMAIDVTGDNGERRFVYDGATISLLHRTKGLYSEVKVSGTIDAALDLLASDYGIVVPLEDLAYSDLYDRLLLKASEGQYLGLHAVGDTQCHHVAFRAGDSSWEFWIEPDESPVLRKITIDYGRGGERLRYSAEISEWNASPSFSAETFEFKLPEGVKRFVLTPRPQEHHE